MIYAIVIIGLCNIALIICLLYRIDDIGKLIKINRIYIEDIEDQINLLMDIKAVKKNQENY
jgi:hypothetical protein|uniref:Uncharacterized protein n=1 Tax=Podoviridae sp. ct8Lf7 TaxID=2827723 RepID=A0A8S5RZU9_9CAUD|nr:MAG TPA: hypothetical protein [Podoviridae sp. ct8Lf7]